MYKKSSLNCAFVFSLSLWALSAQAHQIWLERDAAGPTRIYVGDADDAADSGTEVAKLAPNTQVFSGDHKELGKLVVTEDHLEITPTINGDLRLINNLVWQPWKTKEGLTKAAVFTARVGRNETRAVTDYELVPIAANSNQFTLVFKGQPVADKRVTVVSPYKWTKNLKTDKAGRVDVPVRDKGRYVLISTHDADAAGEVEIGGQKIQKLGYTTTLSFIAE